MARCDALLPGHKVQRARVKYKTNYNTNTKTSKLTHTTQIFGQSAYEDAIPRRQEIPGFLLSGKRNLAGTNRDRKRKSREGEGEGTAGRRSPTPTATPSTKWSRPRSPTRARPLHRPPPIKE